MTPAAHQSPDFPGHRQRAHRAERRGMRVLFLLCFPLCLIAAIAERLGGHGVDATGRPGVLAEARSAAHAAVGYAFHA